MIASQFLIPAILTCVSYSLLAATNIPSEATMLGNHWNTALFRPLPIIASARIGNRC